MTTMTSFPLAAAATFSMPIVSEAVVWTSGWKTTDATWERVTAMSVWKEMNWARRVANDSTKVAKIMECCYSDTTCTLTPGW